MRTSLVVTPTQETIRRLSAMVASSILTLDIDLMAIEIAAIDMEVDWTPEPVTVYSDVQVKEVTTESQAYGPGVVNCLVAHVESSQLRQRALLLDNSLGEGGFRWVLKYDVPPGRSTLLAVASLTDVLVYREAPFSFSDEMLLRV